MNTRKCLECEEVKLTNYFPRNPELPCKKCRHRLLANARAAKLPPHICTEECHAITRRCVGCGLYKPLSQFRVVRRRKTGHSHPCKNCAQKINDTWVDKNREKANGYYATYDEKNREKRNAKAAERRQNLRFEVLQAYGHTCTCCGESRHEFLAVDHINGDGAYDRRAGRVGYVLYLWLKQNGYPKDRFRLLCHNCNSAIGFYGYCPHAKEGGQHAGI
jgi:hypothetical protein